MAADLPKPLLDLDGRTILQHSVSAFDRHPAVSELVVVLPAEWLGSASTLVGAASRRCAYVAGGAQRHDSVRAGFSRLSGSVDVVLIHDAARPFADPALIDRVLEAARDAGAAVPAVPARDTVKRVDPQSRLVLGTIPRSHVWLAQTPQGFQRAVLENAMRDADGRDATDEAVLVERSGHEVRVVQGDERNVKITTPDDLAAARARLLAAPRVGTGYDLHRLVEHRPLVFAGIVVPFDRGPLGHSDGDVVCHALVDAILGAAGAGDIGRHFPNTDPQWKGAPGLDLLARAVAVVADAGFAVTSADVTVILERPTLAPHLDAIRAALAGVLGVPVGQVSVKGKTNEGVDATGRGDAIAAHAVAVLVAGRSR